MKINTASWAKVLNTMTITSILFDIDGTLVQLPINWNDVVTTIRSSLKDGRISFLGFVAKYHGTDLFWQIHKQLEELELEAVKDMRILDNASKYLSRVCKRYSVGFITMQSRTVAEKILSILGVDRCPNSLGVLSTREDSRSRIEQIARAVKAVGVEPKHVLFIGDKVLDAVAAVLNGVNAIVVLRNPRSMRISDTDYIDEDLEVLGVAVALSLPEALAKARELYELDIEI